MEDTAVPQTASPVGGAPWPLPRRFVALFTSPKALFEELENRPSWLVPMLITLFAVALFVAILWNPVMLPEQLTAIEDRPNAEVAATMLTTNGIYFALGFGIPGTAIALFVYSWFVQIVGAFLLGGTLRYKQALSIVCHTSMLGLVAQVVRIPLAFISKSVKVSVGPGMLLPPGTAEGFAMKFLSGFLANFDLFILWQTALVALGVSVIGRVPRGKANAAIWALFVLMSLCFGLLAGISPR
jgi:hypothetical protein